jgi:hypothetical protein
MGRLEFRVAIARCARRYSRASPHHRLLSTANAACALTLSTPQTESLRTGYSPSCLPLAKEDLRALETIVFLSKKPARRLHLTTGRQGAANAHKEAGSVQHHEWQWHAISRCACAAREDTWDTA